MIQLAGILLSGKDRYSFRVYQQVTSKPAIRQKFAFQYSANSPDSYTRSHMCSTRCPAQNFTEQSFVLKVSYLVGRECIDAKIHSGPAQR